MLFSYAKRTMSTAFLGTLTGAGIMHTTLCAADDTASVGPPLLRSEASGAWSAPATWEGGKVPQAGARVQVRTGHAVTYDVNSDQVIRSIHVAGTLRFAHDRDTRLDVGLIKIQPGDDASENGFDCEAHLEPPALLATDTPGGWRSARAEISRFPPSTRRSCD